MEDGKKGNRAYSDLELMAAAIVDGIDWSEELIADTDRAYEKLFLAGELAESARRWREGEGACRLEQHERRAVLMQVAIVHREKLLDGGMDAGSVDILMRSVLTMVVAGEQARDELRALRLETMNGRQREDSVVTMN